MRTYLTAPEAAPDRWRSLVSQADTTATGTTDLPPARRPVLDGRGGDDFHHGPWGSAGTAVPASHTREARRQEAGPGKPGGWQVLGAELVISLRSSCRCRATRQDYTWTTRAINTRMSASSLQHELARPYSPTEGVKLFGHRPLHQHYRQEEEPISSGCGASCRDMIGSARTPTGTLIARVRHAGALGGRWATTSNGIHCSSAPSLWTVGEVAAGARPLLAPRWKAGRRRATAQWPLTYSPAGQHSPF